MLDQSISDCQNPHFFVPKVCACWWYVHGLSSCSDTSQSYLHPKMRALLDLRTLDLAKLVYHRFMLLLFRTLWLYLLLFIVVNSLNEVCQEIVFCIDLLTSMKLERINPGDLVKWQIVMAFSFASTVCDAGCPFWWALCCLSFRAGDAIWLVIIGAKITFHIL